VLVLAMVLIALVRGLAFGRGAPAAAAHGASAVPPQGPAAQTSGAAAPPQGPGARDRVGMVLLGVNMLLGIGVLLLSALSAVIARGGPQ